MTLSMAFAVTEHVAVMQIVSLWI